MITDSIVGGDKCEKSAKIKWGRQSCQEDNNLEVSTAN